MLTLPTPEEARHATHPRMGFLSAAGKNPDRGHHDCLSGFLCAELFAGSAAMMLRAAVAAIALLTAVPAFAAAPLPASIGAATMMPDGTITLRLRAEGEGGKIGEGQVTYRPGTARYDEVLRHLGGLKPGETKPVPPWKD
jgi:hypothetical protein